MWKTIGRPLQMGPSRSSRYAEYDALYGKDGWRFRWTYGEELLALPAVLDLYEQSYVALFENNAWMLETLIKGASDVYDDDPSNVGSGLDWSIQETDGNHFQDIAVRRALCQLGKTFQGTELVQVRSNGAHELSRALSPGFVDFVRPELIVPQKGWWQEGSVEAFYQNNRILQTN